MPHSRQSTRSKDYQVLNTGSPWGFQKQGFLHFLESSRSITLDKNEQSLVPPQPSSFSSWPTEINYLDVSEGNRRQRGKEAHRRGR